MCLQKMFARFLVKYKVQNFKQLYVILSKGDILNKDTNIVSSRTSLSAALFIETLAGDHKES